jgi:HK97 gp10 family phage protein
MIDASDVTQFAARLRREPDEKEWQSEWSRKVADDMRSFAPSRTGALRASIQATRDGVEVGVRYGSYVNYGTSDTAPQPFVAPAINKNIGPAAADAGRRVLRLLT